MTLITFHCNTVGYVKYLALFLSHSVLLHVMKSKGIQYSFTTIVITFKDTYYNNRGILNLTQSKRTDKKPYIILKSV